jgi:hypothetical protein
MPNGRREVKPAEQYVHGFLGRAPLMATVLLTVLQSDQARSTLGLGGAPDWRLKPKRRRLTPRYRAGVLASLAALVAAPYGEELVLPACGRKCSGLAGRSGVQIDVVGGRGLAAHVAADHLQGRVGQVGVNRHYGVFGHDHVEVADVRVQGAIEDALLGDLAG